MTEERLNDLWISLDSIPRVDGVPVNSEDDERERILIQAIQTYEAECDLEEWKRKKGLGGE